MSLCAFVMAYSPFIATTLNGIATYHQSWSAISYKYTCLFIMSSSWTSNIYVSHTETSKKHHPIMIFFSVPVFRAPPGRCANPRRSSSARKAHQDRRDEEKTPLLTEDREELKRLLEEEMKALSVAEKKRDEAYKRLQDA